MKLEDQILMFQLTTHSEGNSLTFVLISAPKEATPVAGKKPSPLFLCTRFKQLIRYLNKRDLSLDHQLGTT